MRLYPAITQVHIYIQVATHCMYVIWLHLLLLTNQATLVFAHSLSRQPCVLSFWRGGYMQREIQFVSGWLVHEITRDIHNAYCHQTTRFLL
jgi:hypothetical protein